MASDAEKVIEKLMANMMERGIAINVKFLDRDAMVEVMEDTTDFSEIDDAMNDMLSSMAELDEDVDDNDDYEERHDAVHKRLEAVAMTAAVLVIEHAKWAHRKRIGYIDNPLEVIKSTNMFLEHFAKKLGTLIRSHIENLDEAKEDAKAEAQEAPQASPAEEYCYDGCPCPDCEQLRTKHAAQFGGEVIKVEGPSLNTGDSPF